MNPMYGQVANAYSGEMQDTVRLNAGLDQQRAQFPNTLYDRFMSAYQQEYLRRNQEAEAARRQEADSFDRQYRTSQLQNQVYDELADYSGSTEQAEWLKARAKTAGLPEDVVQPGKMGWRAQKTMDEAEQKRIKMEADAKRDTLLAESRIFTDRARAAQMMGQTPYQRAQAAKLESETKLLEAKIKLGAPEAEIAYLKGKTERLSRAVERPAPTGYRFTDSGNLEPIPGGPVANKIAAAKDKSALALNGAIQGIQRSKAQAERILDHPGLSTLTGAGTRLGYGKLMQGGVDVQAEIDVLRNQIGMETIQSLKALAANGSSGLGPITEKEWTILQNNIASLETAQSDEQFRASLERIIDWADGAAHRIADAYNSTSNSDAPTSGGLMGGGVPNEGDSLVGRATSQADGTWRIGDKKYVVRGGKIVGVK